MMTDFEKCKRAYDLGATKEQLKVWVRAERITAEQYQEITGEPYEVA
jgi:uncharacterized XkdX family phage protein